jgi:surface carbohydrate biosynthesis protein
MSERTLVVPCETQAREFDAKLLLSCVAAERGFSVIVGSKKQINRRMASLPRSIYLSKSLTKRNLLNYEMLQKMGHAIVCGDEEALVYASPESYLHHKVAAATLRKAEALVAWGPENERVWRDFDGYHGAPIYVTGNPRIDLLRPELRAFFAPAAQKIRERIGRFVLVNTNFSRINHYFPAQSRQRRALERAEGSHLDLGLAEHKSRLFRHFREMIPALARAFPDQPIVIRPHPSESQDTWREVAAGLSNVRVIHEGNVVPWLLAAHMVLHNGCTTAIEAYMLGVPAIAYQPVRSRGLDLELPNALSHRAFDLEQLLQLAKDQLGGGIASKPDEEAAKQKLIEEHVAARTGPLASERIVDALERFEAERNPGQTALLAARLLARGVAGARGLAQRIEAYVPGHHNNRAFLRHMFPGATQGDVASCIERYGELLGRFSAVRVSKLHEDVFQITARPR